MLITAKIQFFTPMETTILKLKSEVKEIRIDFTFNINLGHLCFLHHGDRSLTILGLRNQQLQHLKKVNIDRAIE